MVVQNFFFYCVKTINQLQKTERKKQKEKEKYIIKNLSLDFTINAQSLILTQYFTQAINICYADLCLKPESQNAIIKWKMFDKEMRVI